MISAKVELAGKRCLMPHCLPATGLGLGLRRLPLMNEQAGSLFGLTESFNLAT